MVKIVLTPDWFLGKDVMIEVFSLIVLAIFVSLAYRYYSVNRNRRMLYLGTGFGLIALAQLANILTKLVLYYDFGPTRTIAQAVITNQLVSSVDLFYYAGFFFYQFFTLFGLYVIYRLPRERKTLGDYFLVVYFMLLSAFFSKEFYYLFHLTSLLLLVLIVENYYRVYQENKFLNTKILISAFSLLALSQLIFVLSSVDVLFVVANLVELTGYTILLAIIIRIWKYGKKTKPYGDNIRHVGNNPGKKREH